MSKQALSPFTDPAVPVLLALVSATAGATLTLLTSGLLGRPVGAARSGKQMSQRSPRKMVVDTVVLVSIVLTSAPLSWGAGNAARGLTSTAAITRTTVVLCIALALAVGLVVRGGLNLPTRRPAPTLTLRRLRHMATSSTITAVALALVTAVTVALATSTATEKTVMNSTVVSAVPATQVDLGYSPAPGPGLESTVRHEFEQYTALSHPVVLRTVLISADSVNDEPPIISGLPTAVASVDDLERLLARPLTDEERQGFVAGKLLTTKPVNADRVELSSQEGASTSLPVILLSQVPPEYREATAGFVAFDTVHDLPMEAKYYVYTGLDAQQVERAREAPVKLGFDPSWVRSQEQPVMFETSPAWVLTSWVMVAAVVLIAALLARAQARAVQPYLGGLYAVGVGPSMLRRVVLTQMVVLVGLPVAGGILMGILAAAGVWALFPEPAAVTVPWPVVGVAAAGCVSAIALGALPGIARLSARVRFGD